MVDNIDNWHSPIPNMFVIVPHVNSPPMQEWEPTPPEETNPDSVDGTDIDQAIDDGDKATHHASPLKPTDLAQSMDPLEFEMNQIYESLESKYEVPLPGPPVPQFLGAPTIGDDKVQETPAPAPPVATPCRSDVKAPSMKTANKDWYKRFKSKISIYTNVLYRIGSNPVQPY